MRTVLSTALLATALLPPALALAAHPLSTDDTGTQGDRGRQLELTAEHGRDASSSGGATSLDHAGQAGVTLALGIGDAVDLVVGLPTAWGRSRLDGALVSEQVGVADASAEVKWRFFTRGGFSAAVKPGLSLPTGDPRDGLGSGRPGYGLTLIATQEAGPVTLHANAGWSHADFVFPEDAATVHRDGWSASLAAASQVAGDLQLVAEVGAATPADRGATTWPAFALLGAVWSPLEQLDLDAGVRAGLNDAETDLTVLAGAAWRF
jgi:hypothetical protein